jgi:hypothetical protein
MTQGEKMKNKFWLALAVVLAMGGLGYAIQVNTNSPQLADSAATPETAVFRDTKGQFQIDVMTTTEIKADTPLVVGLLAYNTTISNLCVSTGAVIQGWKLAGTASTTCQ